jgi:hypothetical protein
VGPQSLPRPPIECSKLRDRVDVRADSVRRELDAAVSKARDRRSAAARTLDRFGLGWIAAVAVGLLVALVAGLGVVAARQPNRHPSTAAASPRASARSTGAQTAEPATPPASSLPAFVCASEGIGSGTPNPPVALIKGVNTVASTGYDRLAIEFGGGLPAGGIELRTQKGATFTSEPSGQPVTLAGLNGILVVIQGADMHTSFHGPTDLVTDHPVLREVRVVQDFEGVVQLGLGVNGASCYRAFFLQDPARLLIDVKAA